MVQKVISIVIVMTLTVFVISTVLILTGLSTSHVTTAKPESMLSTTTAPTTTTTLEQFTIPLNKRSYLTCTRNKYRAVNCLIRKIKNRRERKRRETNI